jgi:hypothetical protein
MDKELRNTLRNTVTKCRKLLEEAIGELLQGRFGIHADGTIEDSSRLTHLSSDELRYREEVLAHLEHIKASGLNPNDATAQLIREAAFTHLNRLCAYKMMAARGLRDDPVGKGLKSRGFMFYLSDHPEDEALYRGAKEDVAYRHYLDWLNEQLSADIGVLFAKEDLATRLFPLQRVLEKVLDQINSEELADIWAQDETIGWVYQYFTPKELRERSRKENPMPQNSYELAFRNQFYTPRYIVEFLVDNTLGRIWYEMRKGQTTLKERCKYLVRRPTEIFLSLDEKLPNEEAQQSGELSQEELLEQSVYIRHRYKKDPRDIKILDPACGSGHFLLYCFDLLQTIYEEAYHDDELGLGFKSKYPNIDEFRREVPKLILENNLHGIDIDLRSTQISALALWLRAQRAYKELGIQKATRPQIRKTNIICAEPMPGEHDLLEDFLKEVYPPFLAEVVRVIFDRMKLAGEAGSLLTIDEEISGAVAEAKKHWRAIPQQQQLALFRREKLPDGKQGALFDLSGITDEQFWNEAEARVLESLQEYAERMVSNGESVRRRLFADDAFQGFALIDACRRRFDVVLMNPPFGLPTERLKDQLAGTQLGSAAAKNLAWAFALRGQSLCRVDGSIGAIVDRTIFQKSSYQEFRTQFIFKQDLQNFLDLGLGVLDDANVFVSAFTVANSAVRLPTYFVDLRQAGPEQKGQLALDYSNRLATGSLFSSSYYRSVSEFNLVPYHSIAYWVSLETIKTLFQLGTLSDYGVTVGGGLQCDNVFRFIRVFWEVAPSSIGRANTWVNLYNGGEYSLYWLQNVQLVNWKNQGAEIKQYIIELGHSPSRHVVNEALYFAGGLAGGKRGEYFDVHCLPRDAIFSNEGRAFVATDQALTASLLGYLNTLFAQNLVNVFCGQHKGSDYLRRLPFPLELDHQKLGTMALTGVELKRVASSFDETSLEFRSLFLDRPAQQSVKTLASSIISHFVELDQKLQSITLSCRTLIQERVGHTVLNEIENSGWNESAPPNDSLSNLSKNISEILSTAGFAKALLSFAVGCVYGRWDVRIAQRPDIAPKLASPFDPLPACAPASLVSSDGMPAFSGKIASEEWLIARSSTNDYPRCGQPMITDSDYPIRISWDGILVEDPNHPDDIVARTQNALAAIWGDDGEAVQDETCEEIRVSHLREYFRGIGVHSFWSDHCYRYNRNRRKAPIFWYLRSSRGNYGLWLYYHRLDKDIFHKARLNYVEPKLHLEENNLAQLKQRREEVGTTGREGKQLEKDLDKQESFLSELYDFRDKLKRAADLNLEPDLNDGVVLNIAPLWELVPWKEAEKYWKELIAGKYEWSSIAKQLRERGLVKK